jgi:hypothetical protein
MDWVPNRAKSAAVPPITAVAAVAEDPFMPSPSTKMRQI